MQDFNVVDPLYLNGTQLEVVDSFVYLGSTISNDGTISREIEARISKARFTYTSLRHLLSQKGSP